ncbi:MAG TPA: response regulator [Flavobacteriales bacterium]|nr:response regulator [Flavobacteriales bacterium]
MEKVNSVLIIDDEPFMNMINEKIMQKADFAPHIDKFEDAGRALDDLKKNYNERQEFPDCIFVDVNMPGMDGWAFLDELKKFPLEVLHKCKVFMLSASINKSDIEKCKPYRFVADFIIKPLSVDKLKAL